MPRPTLPGTALLALFLASAALGAQDAPLAMEDDTRPVRFGLQATLVRPRQDLRDLTARPGLGGGIFLERELEDGWSLRTRFDYVAFPEEAGPPRGVASSLAPPEALRVAADQASLGAEARYRPPALGGVFFLAGAGGTRVEATALRPGDPPATPPAAPSRYKDKTSFKLGLAGGLGFAFGRGCAVTVRWTAASLGGGTVGTLEGGLEYRF